MAISSSCSSWATADTSPAPAIASSRTVRPPISPTDWEKYPTLTRFSTITLPESGSSSPTIIRKIVDLPAPFGPTSPTFSPRKTANEASRKRMRPACCLETDSRRIIAGRAL
jgi:hypothetical protein